MKKTMLITILFCLCQIAQAEYQTYLQVDKSTQQGKYFILLIVEDEEWDKNADLAQATFLLSPGEKRQQTFKNKKFPNKEYTFSLFLEDKGRLLGESEVVISEDNKKIFSSKQRFALSKQLSLSENKE